MFWPLAILAAYLIGSIPVGYLIGKSRGIDIRQHGSNNVGATNVGRVLGRRLGLLCFILDAIKGAAPVLAVGLSTGLSTRKLEHFTAAELWLWMAAAAAAVLGHLAPIYLKFRGGKGVATSFGAVAATWPILSVPVLAAAVVWYAVLRVKHYMSLASIAAAVSLPLWYLLWIADIVFPPLPDHPMSASMAMLARLAPPLYVSVALAALVVWRHRGNIARLRAGTEPRVGKWSRRGDFLSDSASS